MQALLFLLLVVTPMLVLLPLVGVALDPALELSAYLEFPPLTQYVEHAPFSPLLFLLMALLIAAFVVPFLHRIRAGARLAAARGHTHVVRHAFPWWGWLGVACGTVAWLLAWTRFEWFAAFQQHTFTPLWLAYIVVVNALTWRRSGRCMMVNQTRLFIALFLFSAGFWWFFEYLNRFVQNWYYVGLTGMGPWQYFWFATVPFSTVLPAVLGTQEYLMTFPAFDAGFSPGRSLQVRRPRVVGLLLLSVAGLGLVGLGPGSDYLFPLLWVSPLLIVLGLQLTFGLPGILDEPARGDWRRIATAVAGCLICGFFWEMWNSQSLAKWIYTVPFVDTLHLFEMPILGYAGYLPFGLECLVLGDLVRSAIGRPAGAGEAWIPAVPRQRAVRAAT